MARDNAVHDRQTHPVTRPYVFGGKERLKNPLHEVRRDTWTGIADREADVRPRAETSILRCQGGIDCDGLETHLQHPPRVAHRLLCVDTQIHHHLMQLSGIS